MPANHSCFVVQTYAIIRPRGNGVVSIYYWLFYPFNGGKQIGACANVTADGIGITFNGSDVAVLSSLSLPPTSAVSPQNPPTLLSIIVMRSVFLPFQMLNTENLAVLSQMMSQTAQPNGFPSKIPFPVCFFCWLHSMHCRHHAGQHHAAHSHNLSSHLSSETCLCLHPVRCQSAQPGMGTVSRVT